MIVQDEDGNQDWAFDEIWVYSDPVATTIERIVVDEGDNVGCGGSTSSTTGTSTDTAAAILVPSLSLLGMFAIRRRRRD